MLAVSTISYERVCVLFNIAAQQSAVAATQNLETDEGLKTAAKFLQVIWVLYYLNVNLILYEIYS